MLMMMMMMIDLGFAHLLESAGYCDYLVYIVLPREPKQDENSSAFWP